MLVEPSARVIVMKPAVKPWRPSADTPTRAGDHTALAPVLAGFDFSASIAFAAPYAMPPGAGIATSAANIAERPVIKSVFALAAAKARSAASSSSAIERGEAARFGDETPSSSI